MRSAAVVVVVVVVRVVVVGSMSEVMTLPVVLLALVMVTDWIFTLGGAYILATAVAVVLVILVVVKQSI